MCRRALTPKFKIKPTKGATLVGGGKSWRWNQNFCTKLMQKMRLKFRPKKSAHVMQRIHKISNDSSGQKKKKSLPTIRLFRAYARFYLIYKVYW